jgi:hypothetical protein
METAQGSRTGFIDSSDYDPDRSGLCGGWRLIMEHGVSAVVSMGQRRGAQ